MSEPQSKLVHMANQIATFFRAQGEEAAAKQVADHLKAFWTPRMREDLIQLAQSKDTPLDPIVRAAVQKGALL